MDAHSNSLEQDSSCYPTDTQNPSFVPRGMTVMQGALGRLAKHRETQQQDSSSVEGYRAWELARQQAEHVIPMTVKHTASTKDQDNLTARDQKDTSCSNQTHATQDRQAPPPAKYLTPFEAEYEARKLAAANKEPTSFVFPGASNYQPLVSDYKTQADLNAQPRFKARNPNQTAQLAYVQAKIKEIELSRAQFQVAKWNVVHPSAYKKVEMDFQKRMEDFVTRHGFDLQDVVITPMRIHKSKAEAQAYYEALRAECEEAEKTLGAAPAPAQSVVDLQAECPKQTEYLIQSPAQFQVQTACHLGPVSAYRARRRAEQQAEARVQPVSTDLPMAVQPSASTQNEKTESPDSNLTLDICQLAIGALKEKRQAEAKERAASSNLPMTVQAQSRPETLEGPAPAQTQDAGQSSTQASNQEKQAEATDLPGAGQHPASSQDQDKDTVVTQKDTPCSSETNKSQAAPDAQPPSKARTPAQTTKIAYVQGKIKEIELSRAKVHVRKWDVVHPSAHKAVEMDFQKRLEESVKNQGVDLRDVVITPIPFHNSKADAQAYYNTLLAEYLQVVAPDVVQSKNDLQAHSPKQTESQTQAPSQDQAQTSSEKTANQLCPEEQAQAEEKSGSSELPMTVQPSASTQDQEDLISQQPDDIQEAPESQPSAQAPIQEETPHPKLAFVQSNVKVNEVSLAKWQVDYFYRCTPDYWAGVELQFVESMERFAKRHGVDPKSVVINSVGLAYSRRDAQKQFECLFTMVHDAGHYHVSERTMAELESLKECGAIPSPAPTRGRISLTMYPSATQEVDTKNLLSNANKEIESLKKELAETKAAQSQALKELDAKSEKTRLEHEKQVDYFQRKMITGQVENERLKTKLCKEEGTSIMLRSSLEESEQEVERLRKELEAKSKPQFKQSLFSETSQPLAKAEKDDQVDTKEEAKAKLSAKELAIQNKVMAAFKEIDKEKAKAEAEEKAKIEAKAEIYAKAYVKARAKAKAKAEAEAEGNAEAKAKAKAEAKYRIKAEAKAKAKAEVKAEAKAKAKAEVKANAKAEAKAKSKAEADTQKSLNSLPQAQINNQKLLTFIASFIDHYHKSSEDYQEQVRCLEYDLQKLTEDTDYQIEDLKKEVDEKDDKILELQKELWKAIDERQVARRDAYDLTMQLCNHW